MFLPASASHHRSSFSSDPSSPIFFWTCPFVVDAAFEFHSSSICSSVLIRRRRSVPRLCSLVVDAPFKFDSSSSMCCSIVLRHFRSLLEFNASQLRAVLPCWQTHARQRRHPKGNGRMQKSTVQPKNKPTIQRKISLCEEPTGREGNNPIGTETDPRKRKRCRGEQN